MPIHDCIGFIAAPVTILAAVDSQLLLDCDWVWYASLCVSFVYSAWRIKPKKNITINLARGRSIAVGQGNVWDVKKGIIVVLVNNFLDTQVDDIVMF